MRVRGARAAQAPATHSQAYLWLLCTHEGVPEAALNTGTAVPLAGVDVADVLSAIRTVVHRFDSFRTRLVVADGALRQVVAGHGSLTVLVQEAAASAAQPAAAALVAEFSGRAFALEREWPVRFGLIVSAGVPQWLVVVSTSRVMDAVAVSVVAADMSRLLAGDDPGPVPQFQPVEQARAERSPAGMADSARALAHWRSRFATGTRTILDFTRPGPRRHWSTELTSQALGPAAGEVAMRLGVSSSAVLLAAIAVVFGRYTGHQDVPLNLVCGNRFDEGSRRVAGRLATIAPVRLAVAAADFGTIARQAFTETTEALLAAGGDPAAYAALFRQLAITDGRGVDCRVVIDDMRNPSPHRPGPVPTGARADTTVTTGEVPVSLPTVLFVAMKDTESGAVQLQLVYDPGYLPGPAAEAVVRAVERVVVAASAGQGPPDPAALAEVSPVTRGAEWIRHRSGWISLAAVRELLRQHAGDPAEVFAEPAADGSHRVVAYLATAGGPSLVQLHQRIGAALFNRSDVCAPDWYVRCEQAPAEPADHAGWRRSPVREQGDGRGQAVSTQR